MSIIFNIFFNKFQEPRVLDSILGTLLHFMFPIKMLLRTYSLCILMVDISWVVVNAVCAVMQATYELFRPPPMKSVRLETALVWLKYLLFLLFSCFICICFKETINIFKQ